MPASSRKILLRNLFREPCFSWFGHARGRGKPFSIPKRGTDRRPCPALVEETGFAPLAARPGRQLSIVEFAAVFSVSEQFDRKPIAPAIASTLKSRLMFVTAKRGTDRRPCPALVEETGFEPTTSWSRRRALAALWSPFRRRKGQFFSAMPASSRKILLRNLFREPCFSWFGPARGRGKPLFYTKAGHRQRPCPALVEETGFEPTTSWSRTLTGDGKSPKNRQF